MKIRWFMASLLMFAASGNCSLNSCDSLKTSLKNDSCLCDDFDDADGWTFTCIGEIDTIFGLSYAEGNAITFDCRSNELDYKLLLQHIDLSDIPAFRFKSCPLPNNSFVNSLPLSEAHSLNHLSIEMTQGSKVFAPTLFQNISSTLQGLVLNRNDIESLPESIFQDFSSLQYLSLSDNKLISLPENILLDLSNLTTLFLTNNALQSLPENIFQSLFKLEKLYLFKNQLKSLPNNLFKSLVNLKILDLADNHIELLPEGIFLGLSQLLHVRLRGNHLRILPKDLFSYSINVRDIDLSLNGFQEPLPEELFYGLNRLENISLHDCNLALIHETFFSPCSNITHLQLQNNGLRILPSNIFRNNSMLKEVNLNFNHINTLPPYLFPNHKHLEKVHLYHNNISEIPNGLFEHAKNIKTLVLGHNSIQNATRSIFRDLPQLENIDLSNNNLSYFSLDFNKEIKYIDLSHNNLSKIPDFKWSHHLKVENVNLQYNKISHFSIPFLYSTNNREPRLNVANNIIQTVSVQDVLDNDATIQLLPTKDYERYVETSVALYGNPFLCDCNMYHLYKYIQNNEARKRSVRFELETNMLCSQPSNLAGKPIKLLHSGDFRCDIKENCSSPCSCFFRAEDSASIVNCSNRQLKSLPDTVPQNTSVLYFQNNYLNNMHYFNHSIWKKLTDLFLDKNLISSLTNWNIPSKLRTLSLSGNRIKYFPPSLMNFTSFAHEFNLTLSGNPWNCNCSAKPFKKWLAEHYQIVSDVKKIMCANRIKRNNTYVRMPILTYPDDVMCPMSAYPYKTSLIIVTVICIGLAFLLFGVSVLYYRNKQTIIAFVYIHMHNVFMCFFNEEDIDEDKIFDAFVSYSSSDRDVALMLIEELENKDPHFQLCIHERNWVAGHPISWNIFNSVHNSRKTILVISRQFLESMWFQVEFHTAYYQMLEDKIDRLIIIVKGELPPKDSMDQDLQYLLSTKTYLIWEEKWFWEKLKYAMPHKKQLLQNNVMALKDRPDSEKIKTVENQIISLTADRNKANGKSQEIVHNGKSRAVAESKEVGRY